MTEYFTWWLVASWGLLFCIYPVDEISHNLTLFPGCCNVDHKSCDTIRFFLCNNIYINYNLQGQGSHSQCSGTFICHVSHLKTYWHVIKFKRFIFVANLKEGRETKHSLQLPLTTVNLHNKRPCDSVYLWKRGQLKFPILFRFT